MKAKNDPDRGGTAVVRQLCGVAAAALLLTTTTTSATSQGDAPVLAQLGVREAPVALRDMSGWRPPKKILVAVSDGHRLAWFREGLTGGGISIIAAGSVAELKAGVANADGMIGPCIADVVAAGPNLRWVQTSGVGVEDCLAIPAIRDGRVMLTNIQRVTAGTVAEHAMAMMLTLTRQIPYFVSAQREGRWNPQPPANLLALEGKTLLVVGLGNVGTEIASRARAFRMRIIGIRRESGDKPEFVQQVGTPEELPSLVGQADFIVNSTPLTARTEGMFNAAIFARMRPTTLFFNVGRGRSVVTADLVDALRSGKIAGAGLDVVDPEPLPKDHPLWRMPNVLLTAHVADESDFKSERSWMLMRENLRRYVIGDKLLSVVDAKRGY